MRTRLARHGAAVAALSLTLCTPTARAAPAPEAAEAVEAAAGAELAARRAATAGLDFRACPDVEELRGPVRCATLRVPLDYARPDGPQISLTVSRVTATRARGAVRQGALVHNPGGPGASGMSFPLVAELPAWERIAAAYDLVGYAPRGVGRSAPLSCQDPSARTTGPTQEPAEPSPRTRGSASRPPGPTPAAARCGPVRPSRTTRP